MTIACVQTTAPEAKDTVLNFPEAQMEGLPICEACEHDNKIKRHTTAFVPGIEFSRFDPLRTQTGIQILRISNWTTLFYVTSESCVQK